MNHREHAHDTNTTQEGQDGIAMVNKRLDECFKEIADLKSRWITDDAKSEKFEISNLNILNAGTSMKPYYVKPY